MIFKGSSIVLVFCLLYGNLMHGARYKCVTLLRRRRTLDFERRILHNVRFLENCFRLLTETLIGFFLASTSPRTQLLLHSHSISFILFHFITRHHGVHIAG